MKNSTRDKSVHVDLIVFKPGKNTQGRRTSQTVNAAAAFDSLNENSPLLA